MIHLFTHRWDFNSWGGLVVAIVFYSMCFCCCPFKSCFYPKGCYRLGNCDVQTDSICSKVTYQSQYCPIRSTLDLRRTYYLIDEIACLKCHLSTSQWKHIYHVCLIATFLMHPATNCWPIGANWSFWEGALEELKLEQDVSRGIGADYSCCDRHFFSQLVCFMSGPGAVQLFILQTFSWMCATGMVPGSLSVRLLWSLLKSISHRALMLCDPSLFVIFFSVSLEWIYSHAITLLISVHSLISSPLLLYCTFPVGARETYVFVWKFLVALVPAFIFFHMFVSSSLMCMHIHYSQKGIWFWWNVRMHLKYIITFTGELSPSLNFRMHMSNCSVFQRLLHNTLFFSTVINCKNHNFLIHELMSKCSGSMAYFKQSSSSCCSHIDIRRPR